MVLSCFMQFKHKLYKILKKVNILKRLLYSYADQFGGKNL